MVTRQTSECFITCIENAFHAFGGVPRTIVVDHLKAAVIKADWFDPELNPKLLDFCRHYNTTVLPTKPYTPRHKGKRTGTVYLGRTPEANQKTLSNQLTSLLAETIRRCGRQLPEVVYVTDAGKVETAYWKSTLRKFFVDGKRIKITRVVDYYHASERLTKIADALKFAGGDSKRQAWLERVRKMLLEPGGHGRVMRSIAKMRELYGYKSAVKEQAVKAEKYLRRYKTALWANVHRRRIDVDRLILPRKRPSEIL